MRLREQLAFQMRRGGIYLNRARRSVWVHGRDATDFEAVAPMLKWLRTAISAERLLLTSDRARPAYGCGRAIRTTTRFRLRLISRR